MIANADVTLITLLEYKQIIFDLIDMADGSEVKGCKEFSVPYYNHLLTQTLARESDSKNRKRIGLILALDSLERCELLAYWDKREDTFIFQPFVIDMFRHLECHRLQELSDAALNGLHQRLKTLLVDVSSPSFCWYTDSIEFKEQFAHLITTLRDVNARIDQNVSSLRGQAKTLSEIAEKEIEGGHERAEQVSNALQRIFDLVQRYVLPTLRFLNPDQDWKGADNIAPLRIFAQIMVRFENRNLNTERAQIQRIHWNLLRAAEHIAVVQKSLDVYLTMYQEQRRLYNAIEESYTVFLQQVTALKDGKLRGNTLDTASTLIPDFGLHGLKSHNSAQGALLGLPREEGSHLLEEYLRVTLPKVQDSKRKVTDASKLPVQINEHDRRRRQRFQHLVDTAKTLVIQPNEDLYRQIHNGLQAAISDYSLADLIDAYGLLIDEHMPIKINLGERKALRRGGKVLHYFCRTWNGERNHQNA